MLEWEMNEMKFSDILKTFFQIFTDTKFLSFHFFGECCFDILLMAK